MWLHVVAYTKWLEYLKETISHYNVTRGSVEERIGGGAT